MNALVVLNISSIDALADAYGIGAADTYVQALLEEIKRFHGRVYIVDQKWPVSGKLSGPRLRFERRLLPLMVGRDVERVRFDDRREEFADVLAKLWRLLQRDGVDRVYLGGLWFNRALHEAALDEGEGAVAYQYLRQYYPTRVIWNIAAVPPHLQT